MIEKFELDSNVFEKQSMQQHQDVLKKQFTDQQLYPQVDQTEQLTCSQKLSRCCSTFINRTTDYFEFDRIFNQDGPRVDLARCHKRFLDNYDQTYSQRQLRFAYSFEHVLEQRIKQELRKEKDFCTQLTRFLCCEGGNEMQQTDQAYLSARQYEKVVRTKLLKKKKQLQQQNLIPKQDEQQENNIKMTNQINQVMYKSKVSQGLKAHQTTQQNLQSAYGQTSDFYNSIEGQDSLVVKQSTLQKKSKVVKIRNKQQQNNIFAYNDQYQQSYHKEDINQKGITQTIQQMDFDFDDKVNKAKGSYSQSLFQPNSNRPKNPNTVQINNQMAQSTNFTSFQQTVLTQSKKSPNKRPENIDYQQIYNQIDRKNEVQQRLEKEKTHTQNIIFSKNQGLIQDQAKEADYSAEPQRLKRKRQKNKNIAENKLENSQKLNSEERQGVNADTIKDNKLQSNINSGKRKVSNNVENVNANQTKKSIDAKTNVLSNQFSQYEQAIGNSYQLHNKQFQQNLRQNQTQVTQKMAEKGKLEDKQEKQSKGKTDKNRQYSGKELTQSMIQVQAPKKRKVKKNFNEQPNLQQQITFENAGNSQPVKISNIKDEKNAQQFSSDGKIQQNLVIMEGGQLNFDMQGDTGTQMRTSKKRRNKKQLKYEQKQQKEQEIIIQETEYTTNEVAQSSFARVQKKKRVRTRPLQIEDNMEQQINLEL